MDENRIGELIDKMFEAREEKLKLENEAKKFGQKQAAIETELKILMEEHGLEKAAGKYATVTKKIQIVPKIVDLESFYRWAVSNNKWEFLMAKCKSAPVQDMVVNENKTPKGVITDAITKINMRRK